MKIRKVQPRIIKKTKHITMSPHIFKNKPKIYISSFMCQLNSLTWLEIVFALVHLGLRAFIYAQLSRSHHTTFQWGSGLFFDWNTKTPQFSYFSVIIVDLLLWLGTLSRCIA